MIDLYPRLPVFAQNWVCDVYGWRLKRERFGGPFDARLRELLQSEWMPANQIAERQDAEVRNLVRHAYENVPFYSQRMRELRIVPQDINGVRDLGLLPITTKSDIRAHARQMFAKNIPRSKLKEMHTSGTTGSSLTFSVDRAALPLRWAVWWRHRVRFGATPGEWHVNFTGKLVVPPASRRPPFWRRSRPIHQYLVNMQHLTRDRIRSLARDLDELGPRFFSGYPSIVHVYCQLLAEEGIELRRPPKLIFTGAENILEHQRRDIEAVTNAVLTDQYGFTEGCGNASQCEHFNYHEDFEYGVLECVDAVKQANGEIAGRVIATGFASYGFPFLRYDVGDMGVWAPESFTCPCGRKSRVLARVEGRVDDYVLTPEGRRIMRFDYLFKDTPALREAQVVQKELGEITIRAVLEAGASEEDLLPLRDLVGRWISPTLRVRFETLPHLERKANGKFQAVVSLLPRATATPSRGAESRIADVSNVRRPAAQS